MAWKLTFRVGLCFIVFLSSSLADPIPNEKSKLLGKNDALCEFGDGIFQNPYDCSTYFRCENGLLYLENCPPGLEYNDRFKNCTDPATANCVEIASSTAFTTVPTTPTTPTTTTTTMRPTTRPVNTTDDVTIDPSDRTSTSTTPTTPSWTTTSTPSWWPSTTPCYFVPNCEPYPPGNLLENPCDNTTYFHCGENGEWFLEHCPPGTIFNPHHLTCEWPSKINRSVPLTKRNHAWIKHVLKRVKAPGSSVRKHVGIVPFKKMTKSHYLKRRGH